MHQEADYILDQEIHKARNTILQIGGSSSWEIHISKTKPI